jgi:type I site-specific restriction-modification system R (restriction) subunit
MSIEDELLEIENYIKTLELNDETNKEINKMIEDGTSKGLIYDFISTHYRGTMFSSKVIKKEEYDEFQKYINRCEEEQNQAHKKFVENIINSGDEYSKDELKYIKIL